jgi:hypothetical protein
MASVTKRPSGQWRARYRDSTGHEHAKHFSRKVDATKWLDSITATIAIGTYVDPAAGQITLGEYAQTWLNRQVHLKPSTRSRYRTIVRVHIEPAFGAVPLATIEHSAVAAWIVDLLDDGSRRRQCGTSAACCT